MTIRDTYALLGGNSAAERSSSMSQHQQNRRAWDAMVRHKRRFARPARRADFENMLRKMDRAGWLEGLAGKELLCLAAGGGRQGPLYAALGAHVTVVDISAAQLELDRQMATERGLHLRTVQTSMDDLSMFAIGEFDIVIQPVSTCYVPEVRRTYAAVARVTRTGGIYISQHKQPVSLQASTQPSANGYVLSEPYYREGPLPPVSGSLHREEGTLEYLHRWEELIGAMCRAGFVIEDLVEPHHAEPRKPPGTFAHRSCYVAPYFRIKARRVTGSPSPAGASAIVIPGTPIQEQS